MRERASKHRALSRKNMLTRRHSYDALLKQIRSLKSPHSKSTCVHLCRMKLAFSAY